MEDRELEALLAELESDRTERKESIADPQRIRQAICAFANDLPSHGEQGVIFVGARDDGSCAGLRVTATPTPRTSPRRSWSARTSLCG